MFGFSYCLGLVLFLLFFVYLGGGGGGLAGIVCLFSLVCLFLVFFLLTSACIFACREDDPYVQSVNKLVTMWSERSL